MSIADLYNVPVTDADVAQWSNLHLIQHRLTNEAVLRTKNIALPEYVLAPIDLNDPQAFLYQHQQMHNAVDQLYGISGYNLTDVNWSDVSQREGWIFLNAQLHVDEAQMTGAY